MKNLYSKFLLLAAIVFALGANAQTTTFSYVGDFETYTVPAGVTNIGIEALGAQGAAGDPAYVGGNGAKMYGEFSVSAGDVLIIAVGGMGGGQSSNSNGGGGGGTFVVKQNPAGAYTFTGGTFSGSSFDPMIIAGGGGGTRASVSQNGNPGVTTTGGTTGSGSGMTGGGAPSTASDGMGGIVSSSSWGSAGGGLTGNGANDGSYGQGGQSFISGALGGNTGSCGDAATGGFGCGGQGRGCYGGGGGGGYTGGDGGRVAGGGGSFNSGINQDNANGFNSGNGSVTITVLCTALSTTVSSDTVCVGEEVILHAESTIGGTVTWDGGVTDSVAFTIDSAGVTTYTATSDTTDCAFVIDIFVGDYPTADAGSDQSICEGDSVQLTGTGSGTDLSWDGGVVDGDWFTPASAGTNTYVLSVSVDSTGCTTTDTVLVEYNVIDASVTYASGTLTSTQTGATYQWINCADSSDVAGATSQDFTPTQNGDYAVIIDLNGCVDTSACESVSDVGIVDYTTDADYAVYPNPASTDVIIKAVGSFTYSIMDAAGRVVLMGEGEESIKIDLTAFEAGTYMISVQGEEQYLTKLVKK